MSTDAASSHVESGAALLRELALDLRWSWNHATDELWKQLEPDLWARTHNPWVVLRTVSRQRLTQMLADPAFRKNLDRFVNVSQEAAAKSLLPQILLG
jgi:starch phosphorylase